MRAFPAATLTVCTSFAVAQPEYEVTDITEWTQAQLATLPRFKHFIPVAPDGAPPGMIRRAQAGGVTVGHVGSTYGSNAAFVRDGEATIVPPIGTYYWERIWWDGDDWHFQNGFVAECRANDVNASGLIVGESTLDGRGEYWYEYETTAILFAADDPTPVDLTPGRQRAAATGINDAGEICGWWSEGGGSITGFRRGPSGDFTELNTTAHATTPRAINESGRIAGGLIFSGTGSPYRAFVGEAGSSVIVLDLPPTGPATHAEAYDLNDADLIVGASWDIDQAYEHFATLWQREADGSWRAHDLNELLTGGDVLLENAVAVNDAGQVISSGRPDGSDLFGSRVYLLTPAGQTTCPADLAPPQGVLDLADINAFVTAFVDHDDPADMNGDGIYDLDDIGLFVSSFLAGCP